MKVLIVDDHPVFQDALAGLARSLFPGCDARIAATHEEAVAALGADRFDLLVLDLILPGASGLAGLIELSRLAGDTPVLVVSGVEDEAVIRQLRLCGVNGYVSKTRPLDRIAACMRLVVQGAHSCFPDLPCEGEAPGGAGLTHKQIQVAALLVRGLSNKHIANTLGISPNTVKFHVTEILRRLGVGSRAQAISLLRSSWDSQGESG